MDLIIQHTYRWEIKNGRFNLLLFSLHQNEYGQEIDYYPFVVKLDRYVGICHTFNGYVFKIKQYWNIRVFNRIIGNNESTILTKDV